MTFRTGFRPRSLRQRARPLSKGFGAKRALAAPRVRLPKLTGLNVDTPHQPGQFSTLAAYLQILTQGGDDPNYWESPKAHDRGDGIGPDPRSRDEAPTPGNSRPNPSSGWRYEGPDPGSSRPTSGGSWRDQGPADGDINGAGDW